MSNSTNPYEQDGQDLDMLTDDELIERGLEPRFTELTELDKPTPQPEHRCQFCGRKIKNPVFKYEKGGIDFIDDNKAAHQGCAHRQFELVKEALKLG